MSIATRIPLAVLLLLLGGGRDASAQGWPGPDEVRAMIVEAAERHGARADQLVAVVRCESTFRPWVIGRHGERGVSQWHPARSAAWRMTSHARAGVWIAELYAAGDPDALWLDIDGLAEVFATQPAAAQREWSCWRRG